MTDWKNGNGWSFEDQQERNDTNRHPTKDNKPVRFKVVEHIATLSSNETGWRKELNKVSWNGSEAKFDIRSWKDDYSKVGKGVTLFEDEMIVLANAITNLNLNQNQKEE